MFGVRVTQHLFLAALVVLAGAARQATAADNPENQFYKAYYLERATRDTAAAARLYNEVAGAKGAPEALRSQAQVRLAACTEDLAATDLAQLMPPEPLAYLEIREPGERVRRLLGKLGLLSDPAKPQTPGEPRLAISPKVLEAVLGLRGFAVAVTGVNFQGGQPTGVAVLHPGDMELVRGLIETALPAGAEVLPPLDGHPTYGVESFVVTITNRLVIAASSPVEIEAVLDRLRDPKAESLGRNPAAREFLAERESALVFFHVNPQPLMPALNGMLAAAAAEHREAALANAVLDPKSFRSLSGRLNVDEDGLALLLTVRLDEGHRNLVYNFLRRPALRPETLACVPAGAAGFLALSLNEPLATSPPAAAPAPDAAPVVTAMDLGREFFANMNGLALFALPPSAGAAAGPIPDVALAVQVNDPTKSQALWGQLLGLASLAAGAPTMDGEPRDVAGIATRGYRFEGAVSVQVGTVGKTLLIATNPATLERAVQAQRGGTSVLKDEAFARPLALIGPSTTFAAVVHPGRCLELARPHMSPGELRDIEPLAREMKSTTVCLTIDQSDHVLRLAAALSGLPDVSGVVTEALKQQRSGRLANRQLDQALGSGDWAAAVALLDERLAQQPGDRDALRRKFDILATRAKDTAAATTAARTLGEHLGGDAMALNNLAWQLLTEAAYAQQYDVVALELARRANELTNSSQWMLVDTLALAEFRAGNPDVAIALEEQAIALCRAAGEHGRIGELEQALRTFRAGAAQASSL